MYRIARALIPTIIGFCLTTGMVTAGVVVSGTPQAAAAPGGAGQTPPTVVAPQTPQQSSPVVANDDDPKFAYDIDLAAMPSSAKSILGGSPAKDQQVPSPGMAVPHRFDAVIANLYDSPDQYPPTPAETLEHARIDTMLSDAAQWWSDNTGMVFDFNTGIRYATINTTCKTMVEDAAAAMGEPNDQAVYTQSGRDLLIFQMGGACDNYNGVSFSVSTPPSVFTGGVFSVVIGENDSAEFSAFTVAHEFGHTIGIMHSNIRPCNSSGSADDQVGPQWEGRFLDDCIPIPYTDWSTIMGNQFSFTVPEKVTLNSIQRQSLGVGWNDTAIVDTTTTSQVFTISRYDLAGSGRPTGVVVSTPGQVFRASLEYRDADSVFHRAGVYLALARMVTGEVSPGHFVTAYETDLLSPVGAVSKDLVVEATPMAPGDTFVSADGSVRLRTLSVDPATARVEVTMSEVPGIPGSVSIAKHGAQLAANVTGALGEVGVAYQWVRNGQPVPGATQATYTPPMPDPNAVYRVEATFSATGYATTTRYSRGIVPDDQRLAGGNGEMTMILLDANGQPVDCDGMPVSLDVAEPNGGALGEVGARAEATGVPGQCRFSPGLVLTGVLRVTVRIPAEQNTWQRLYWQPVQRTVTVSASSASAGLMVGLIQPAVQPYPVYPDGWPIIGTNDFDGSGVPRFMVGWGSPPMVVTVSVTDDTGAPAAGVPVTLSSATPGLAFSPVSPVTDEYGLARVTAEWDKTMPPPMGCTDATVWAKVPGVNVTGVPAPLQVCNPIGQPLIAWVEGDASAVANGTDTVEVHVRAWDQDGNPITDQADRLHAKTAWGIRNGEVSGITFSDPVWDPAQLDYVMTLTGSISQRSIIHIGFGDDGASSKEWVPDGYLGTISFKAGAPVSLTGSFVDLWANEGNCDGPDTQGWVYAYPTDEYGNTRNADNLDGGVVFSLPPGSPLKFTSDPVVGEQLNDMGYNWGYAVHVTSAVSGWFDVNVASADGRFHDVIQVLVSDAPIDPGASRFTLSDGPRVPDGKDSYTWTADLVGTCHLPVTHLSTGTPGKNERYQALLAATDPATGEPMAEAQVGAWTADPAKPGTYTVPVTSNVPNTYSLILYTVYLPFLPGDAPVYVVTAGPWQAEFVAAPVVVVGVPVIAKANATVIAGTVSVEAGQSEPVSVSVTYPVAGGTATAQATVSKNAWSLPTPAGAVDGPLSVVAVDAEGHVSVAVAGTLDVTAPGVPVVDAIGESSVSGTVPPPVDPGVIVTVTWPNGTNTSAGAGTDGKWTVAIPAGMKVCSVSVVARDAAGNVSKAGVKTVDCGSVPPVPKPVAGTGGTAGGPAGGAGLVPGLVLLLIGTALGVRLKSS